MAAGGGCGLRQRGGKKSTSSSLKTKSTKRSFKRSKNLMRMKPSKGSRKTMRRGMSKKSTMSKKSKKSKPVKKTKKKGKKALNPYMKALKKARDNNEPSFTYNGKTYYQKKTKTGMIIYGAKK